MFTAKQARTFWGRRRCFQTRHAAYCVPVGKAAPLMRCFCRAGSPHDAFDRSRYTRQYSVGRGRRVVGTARLNGFDPAIGEHQAEHFTEFAGIDRTRVKEITRLALDPKFLDQATDDERREALLVLLGRIVRDSIARGEYDWIMTMRGGVLLSLSKMSIPFRLSGDGQPVTFEDGLDVSGPLSGEPLFPATIDLLELAAAMYDGSPEAYHIMFGTDQPPAVPLAVLHRLPELRDRIAANNKAVLGHLLAWRKQQRAHSRRQTAPSSPPLTAAA